MPYRSNADLPDSLRRVLPGHAQGFYRAAFNNAWPTAIRQGDEAVAHRIAWAAVKRRYRKSGDLWLPRPDRDRQRWDGRNAGSPALTRSDMLPAEADWARSHYGRNRG